MQPHSFSSTKTSNTVSAVSSSSLLPFVKAFRDLGPRKQVTFVKGKYKCAEGEIINPTDEMVYVHIPSYKGRSVSARVLRTCVERRVTDLTSAQEDDHLIIALVDTQLANCVW